MATFKNLLLAGFLLAGLPAFAQLPQACAGPSDAGAAFASDACVRCVFDTIHGNNSDHFDNLGISVCGGQISPVDSDWFAFAAAQSSITFQLESSNCLNGNGLQIAIFDSNSNLSDATVLACNAGPAGGAGIPLTLTYDQFMPGTPYYLLVCGKNADLCDYTLYPTQSGAANALPVTPLLPGVIDGPDSLCPGAIGIFTIPVAAGASHYQWQVPPGSFLINDSGTDNYLAADTGTIVKILFGNYNGTIKVKPWSACDFSAPLISSPLIHIAPIAPTILPPLFIEYEDLPMYWHDEQEIPGVPGTYNFTISLISYRGCDSLVKQQVVVLPPAPGSAKGHVYWDANGNGNWDPLESVFTDGALITTSSGMLNTSDALGFYKFFGLSAGDTIRAITPVGNTTVTPAFELYTNGIWEQYDFGISLPPGTFDLSLSSTNMTAFRPGFETDVLVQCHNLGLETVHNVEFKFAMPDFLDYISATPTPSFVSSDSLHWNFGDLAGGETRTITITLYTPVGAPLGAPLFMPGSLTPLANDNHVPNNFYSLNERIFGSYDPNDKQVKPAAITPARLANGERLEYTIRFQNTGNFPADFIRIIDTLENDLDAASFRFIAASHPCSWTVKNPGVVEFYFPDIQLPDSSSNEPASHGFVKFSIKAASGLNIGSVLENFCDIYFDFNAPIRTNTAQTQVVPFMPGEGLNFEHDLSLRPNPAAFSVRCSWKTEAPQQGTLRLFDLTGSIRFETTIAAGSLEQRLNLWPVPAGTYFVVLEAGDLLLAKSLVVVQAGTLDGN